MNKVKVCPKCKKIVEAKEYVSRNDLSDWRAALGNYNFMIVCSKCEYQGLAIEITLDKQDDTV